MIISKISLRTHKLVELKILFKNRNKITQNKQEKCLHQLKYNNFKQQGKFLKVLNLLVNKKIKQIKRNKRIV